VEDPLLRVHGLSPGLNYGDCSILKTLFLATNLSNAGQQAFEGMKGFGYPCSTFKQLANVLCL
jgi:hypothetical protein